MSAPTYTETLALFVGLPSWTLRAACDLAVGRLPGTPDTGGAHQEAVLLIREVALGCVGEGLSVVNDDERPHLPLRVEPRQFAHWASKYVPDLLHADFLSHTESLVDSNLIAEDEGRKPDSRQEAKYRCRGLAAYFWSLEPKVNIREMADRDELRRFGCPEMDTTHSQRRRWIKNLAPSNKPGRPRKRES